MSKAYVETTILTNILLKPGSKKEVAAKAALSRFETTLLPVYAIKEWKAGPLDHYSYLHDKLVTTRSLADSIAAINSLSPYYSPYKRNTSFEALEAAVRLDVGASVSERDGKSRDEENADRYRLILKSLIIRSWRKRRKITTQTIQDLDCYTEAEPKIGKDGLFDLRPQQCDRERECCLADSLKAQPSLLKALRDSIPETSIRREDRQRRHVLKALIKNRKLPLDRDQCRALGDAVFSFFCPADCSILTTNLRDHKPLAESIGKKAESP